ncbi:hypothetical protein CC80DRAFT_398987 [Byssothecium circinans]|uniref:Uncharacterized protein n=1 Tax=Byssothecium circinans TaxID=147558 RepID=A0A6A5UPD9_9PLEO|nr:hypothetical protein CC80DRAFT_398987 [Byssothecium circinans]
MATPQAVRRWILTGAVTAITVTGTIYGANLKSDLEAEQAPFQSTPEEMIAQLEAARTELVVKKTELERKITAFRTRQKEKEQGIEPAVKGR